jgi:hypothetical protein
VEHRNHGHPFDSDGSYTRDIIRVVDTHQEALDYVQKRTYLSGMKPFRWSLGTWVDEHGTHHEFVIGTFTEEIEV